MSVKQRRHRTVITKRSAKEVLRWIEKAKTEELERLSRQQPGLAEWQANEQAAYVALNVVIGKLSFYAGDGGEFLAKVVAGGKA